jgi:hypothetical protein
MLTLSQEQIIHLKEEQPTNQAIIGKKENNDNFIK